MSRTGGRTTVRVAFLDAYTREIRGVVRSTLPPAWEIEFRGASERVESATDGDATVLCTGWTAIDAPLLDCYPKVQMVQKLGSGVDKIDLGECKARGITVARLSGVNAGSVAEHAIMLMLAALRHLPLLDRHLRHGKWLKEEGRAMNRQLAGLQVGLVGMGATGRAVAKRLAGFDVRVAYYDPRRLGRGEESLLRVTFRPLEEIMSDSDVISLHTPLNAETTRLVNTDTLRAMKDGVVIVNCARGGLIDEVALAQAMAGGKVSACAVDTFQDEPNCASPLLTAERSVVTPHVAGATADNFGRVLVRAGENIRRYVAGAKFPDGDLVLAGEGVRR